MIEFYPSEEISREMPNKKDVVPIKVDNNRDVTIMTLASAYQTFKESNLDVKIGVSLWHLVTRLIFC